MKTIAYIDGQNFLYKVADILLEAELADGKQGISDIDIPWLLNQVLEEDEIEIRFYGVKKINRRGDLGAEMYRKSKAFADNLRRVRNCLEKTGVKFVDVGKLKVRDTDVCKRCGNHEVHFQEKGVDVGLAVDLVKDALLGDVEKIILVSSDTDLIPAVLAAKEVEKEIVYVGFEDKITKALVSEADSVQILRKREVVEAWRRMNVAEENLNIESMEKMDSLDMMDEAKRETKNAGDGGAAELLEGEEGMEDVADEDS